MKLEFLRFSHFNICVFQHLLLLTHFKTVAAQGENTYKHERRVERKEGQKKGFPRSFERK